MVFCMCIRDHGLLKYCETNEALMLYRNTHSEEEDLKNQWYICPQRYEMSLVPVR